MRILAAPSTRSPTWRPSRGRAITIARAFAGRTTRTWRDGSTPSPPVRPCSVRFPRSRPSNRAATAPAPTTLTGSSDAGVTPASDAPGWRRSTSRRFVLQRHLLDRSSDMTQRSRSARISRLPPIADPPADPLIAELFEDTRRRGGHVLNLHLTLAHAPKMAKARRATANALRYETTAPRPLIELAILRAAQLAGGEYELNHHGRLGLAAGLTPTQIESLENWRDSGLFDERQRALLAYVEAVIRRAVDDATFEDVAQLFTPQEIVEVTIAAVHYYGAGLLTH